MAGQSSIFSNGITSTPLGQGDARPPRPTSLFSDPSDDEQLTQTMRAAQDTTADQAARIFKLQLKTGLPPALIAEDVDEVERAAAARDFDAESFRRTNPRLAAWLQEDAQRAAIAKDDLANLSTLERAFQVGATSVRSLAAGATFDLISVPFWNALQFTGDVLGLPSVSSLAQNARRQAEGLSTALAGVPETAGPSEQAFYSGFRSVGSTTPALLAGVATGGASLPLGIMGAQVGLSEYGRARDTGVGVPQASLYGLSQAAVEIATERIPAAWLIGDVAKRTGFLKTLFKQGVAEVPGEQLATVFQDLNEFATLRPEASFGDYLAERPSAAAQTLIATLVAVGAQTSLVAAIDRVTGTSNSQRTLQALHAAADASTTRARAPEALASFVQQAAAGGLTHVYAPADTFTEYFQEKGADPAAVAEDLTGSPEAYRLALATGGDLPIPIERYLERVVQSGDEAFFERELRLSPDQSNARETAAALKDEAAPADLQAGPDARDQVHQAVAAQLTATHRYTPSEVEAQATLWASVFEALGSRTGMDALSLYQRFAPRIESVRAVPLAMPTPPAAPPQALPEIPASQASRTETRAQRATRVEGHRAALIAALVRDAQQVDPSMDASEIASEIALRLDLHEEGQAAQEESGRGQDLLRTIARYGGLWWERRTGGFKGEIEHWALEGTDTKDIRDRTRPATWNGVAGVFREEGLTPDGMLEALQEDARFQSLETINDLFDAIDAAMRAEPDADYVPGTAELQELGITPGTAWWDPERAPSAHAPATAVDETLVGRLRTSVFGQAQRLRTRLFGQSDRNIELLQGRRLQGTYDPATRAIRLLSKADRSTFLHESAHHFLEVLAELAADAQAPVGVREDMEQLLNWFEFEGTIAQWRALSAGARRDHHERFARGFEAYLHEGKAPTPELQGTFARFAIWLRGLYAQLRQLKVELTPGVRKVMDRLVATDAAIAAAERDAGALELFTTAAAAGMSETEFEGYRAKVEARSEAARAQLRAQALRELAREDTQAWQAERAQVRAEVAAEVHAQPVYRALAAMRGTQPDGTPLPEGTPATPLSRKALVEQFGKAILKTLPRPYIYSRDSGLDPDTVASFFGFASGQELLDAIRAAPPMAPLIEAQTDDRMYDRYGDLLRDPERLAEQAERIVAGEQRDQVIRAELAELAKLRAAAAPSVRAEQGEQRARIRTGRGRLRSELPDAATLTRIAETQVGSMHLRDVRPDRFMATARRHSRTAIDAAAKQDFDTAIESKRAELLNLALYREALRARDAVEEARQAFERMFSDDVGIAKRRNMDLVQAARAIAAKYFWPDRRQQSALEALAVMKAHMEADEFDALQERIELATSAETLQGLTYGDFLEMRDTVEGLWDKALRDQQILIDGQLVDRQEAVESLAGRLDELGAPASQFERTDSERSLGILGIRAWLRRVESWVDYVDGGSPSGAFRRFLWTPVSQAIDRYRIERGAYLQRYLEILKPIETTLTSQPIAAPELRYTFANKAALLHAVAHTGNDSNFQKLIRGFRWGDLQEDGTVDASRWEAFRQRMFREGVLTKADLDVVQAIWDLNEELKSPAQQVYRDIYGHYFNELTHWPVETPWGTYRGGYVPAAVDPLRSARQEAYSEQALTDGDNAYLFPTAGRGFTKQRNEAFARPLALDLRLMAGHIDKVLRFVHIEPRVRDVGRLLKIHRLSERVNAYDPTAINDMLWPWLQRAATQRTSQPVRGRGARAVAAIARTLRTRTGLNMMAGHTINALQQLTGLSVAAVKVRPRYLRNALWSYLRDHTRTVDFIVESSAFMRTRTTAAAIETLRTLDDLLLNPSRFEQLRDFGKRHGYILQTGTQSVVDNITWTGAYLEASDDGAEHDDAVRQADAAVRQTQGSFAPEDLSRLEASTDFVRLFSMFYGYFNMLANLNGSELAGAARDMGLRKGAGRALYAYAFGFMVPAVIGEAILQGLSGGWEDDDDDGYLDEILGTLLLSQFRQAAAMLPGGVLTAALNFYTTSTTYDDRVSSSPAITVIESTVKAPTTVYEAIVEGKSKRRAVRDFLDAVGLLTGLPVGALKRPASYAVDVLEGNEDPDDVVEFGQGLVSGRAQDAR